MIYYQCYLIGIHRGRLCMWLMSIAIIVWLGHWSMPIVTEYEEIDDVLCSLFTLAEYLVLSWNMICLSNSWWVILKGIGLVLSLEEIWFGSTVHFVQVECVGSCGRMLFYRLFYEWCRSVEWLCKKRFWETPKSQEEPRWRRNGSVAHIFVLLQGCREEGCQSVGLAQSIQGQRRLGVNARVGPTALVSLLDL